MPRGRHTQRAPRVKSARMSTLVDEQPAAPEREPQADQGDEADRAATSADPRAGPPGRRRAIRARTAAPRWSRAQEWCLQCGAAAPGALERSPWRSTGLIVAVIAALGLGAAAAAVAALNQHSATQPTVTHIVAQAPATPPPATTPTPVPATPPASTKTPLPKAPAKLPKVSTTPTPIPTSPHRNHHRRLGDERRIAGLRPERRTKAPARRRLRFEPQPALRAAARHRRGLHLQPLQPSRQLLRRPEPHDRRRPRHRLDRPGEPGDRAEHGRGRADQPQVAEEALGARARQPQQGHGRAGLRHRRKAGADLDHRPRLGRAVVHALAIKKTSTRFKLRKPKVGFRQLVAWISKAPPAAIGTPTAPGHVKVGEVEVFPAS